MAHSTFQSATSIRRVAASNKPDSAAVARAATTRGITDPDLSNYYGVVQAASHPGIIVSVRSPGRVLVPAGIFTPRGMAPSAYRCLGKGQRRYTTKP